METDNSSMQLMLKSAINEHITPIELKIVSLEKDLENLKEMKSHLIEKMTDMDERIDDIEDELKEYLGQVNQIKSQLVTKDENKKFNANLWYPIIFGFLMVLLGFIPSCMTITFNKGYGNDFPHSKIQSEGGK